jgi:DNA-binding CsgD family transcriptional regulator/PAS domain-containing protein
MGLAMGEEERLSALIGEIYDTVLDRSRWTGVVGRIAKFVGGCSAALYARDAFHKSGNVYYHDDGIPEFFRQLYFEKYITIDPSATGDYLAELEEPISTTNLMPYGEFVKTRFFKEWAQPQGLVDFVTSVLDRTPTSAAFFGVFRHQRDGLVDDETRRRMRLIAPHLRRAVVTSKLLSIKTSESATFADMLDGLSAGVCLVDESGSIVHANTAFQSILSEGDYLSEMGGRLAATDADADQFLHHTFSSFSDLETEAQNTSLSLKAVSGESHVAHVVPLTSGARRLAGIETTAAAALFVHKTDIITPSLPDALTRHFKLTPSELRILLAMIEEAGGVAEVAQKLGVTTNTVKTHLARLYAKTGTSRQADLIKVVAGFSAPFLG